MNRKLVVAAGVALLIVGVILAILGLVIYSIQDGVQKDCNTTEGQIRQTLNPDYKKTCEELPANKQQSSNLAFCGIGIIVTGAVIMAYFFMAPLKDDRKKKGPPPPRCTKCGRPVFGNFCSNCGHRMDQDAGKDEVDFVELPPEEDAPSL